MKTRNEFHIGRFSKHLKQARLKKQLTQKELAERIGVTERTIINWEKGRITPKGDIPVPKGVGVLICICNTLECDIDYLLGRIDTLRHETTDICNETGLSEKAAEKLIGWGASLKGKGETLKNPYIGLLNDIIPKLPMSVALDYSSLKSLDGRETRTLNFPTPQDFDDYKKWAEQYPEVVDMKPNQARRFFITEIGKAIELILREVYSDET